MPRFLSPLFKAAALGKYPRPGVSAADLTVSEDVGTASVVVSIPQASPYTAYVQFTTNDGTAVAGTDYTATSGVAEIPATVAVDESANNNDGTLVNGPEWVADGPNENIRGALSFDGVDDYVDIPMSGGVFENWTLEGWIELDDWDSDNRIEYASATEDESSAPLNFGITDGELSHYRGDAAGRIISHDVSSLNGWHHVAIVQDRIDASTVNVKMYLDAVLVGESEGDYENLNDQIWLGANQGSSNFWPGKLSDFRFHETARTQQQIQDNMNIRLNGDESGLVGYWPLDGTSTTVDVAITNRGGSQGSRDLTVDLSNPTNCRLTDAQATVTINDT